MQVKQDRNILNNYNANNIMSFLKAISTGDRNPITLEHILKRKLTIAEMDTLNEMK